MSYHRIRRATFTPDPASPTAIPAQRAAFVQGMVKQPAPSARSRAMPSACSPVRAQRGPPRVQGTGHGASLWGLLREWGAGHDFTLPGCWDLHAGLGRASADGWLDVVQR